MGELIRPYYLVAIPDGAVVQDMLRLQKFISRRFRMYTQPYPSLHLTIGVVESGGDIRRTFPALEQIAARHLPLTVRVNGQRCFDEPFLAVGLAVESRQLAYLAGEVEGKLSSVGFQLRSFARWNFHISLVSPLFSRRLWNSSEFHEACQLTAAHAPDARCTLGKIELWDPEFPPLNLIARFNSK
ncbi:MAG: hypothetical protein KGZ63_01565 [Clostridiales bacterium]|nr:hypothetical protein [Clostridiales bacterium]